MLNVCFTIVGAPFGDFVRERIEARNTGLADRRDLNVAIDPEILQVIQASTAVSTQAGSAAHLLKVGSKRRRTKAEVEEFRAMQADQMQVIASRDARIEELQLSQQQMEGGIDAAVAEREERIRMLESQLTHSKHKMETGE